MILSVSRRTDIPAFYSEWFMNRLRDGYVLVRNPMSYHQVSRINLSPDVVDCIVFWSKNPQPLFTCLDELDSQYKFYFQYTINGYEKDIEPNIPLLDERIDNFIYLSKRYGADNVIWRYDPIMLTAKYTIDWHVKTFEYIASKLSGYTKTCVFSYIDVYEKNRCNLGKLGLNDISIEEMKDIALRMNEIAQRYNIVMKTCSEDINLMDIGIQKSCCIDPVLISDIVGSKIIAKKDKNQRESCGCVESIDIGQYNTCRHACVYCYANYKIGVVNNNVLKHDDSSPMLVGNLEEGDKIHEREVKSLKDMQLSFFD